MKKQFYKFDLFLKVNSVFLDCGKDRAAFRYIFFGGRLKKLKERRSAFLKQKLLNETDLCF